MASKKKTIFHNFPSARTVSFSHFVFLFGSQENYTGGKPCRLVDILSENSMTFLSSLNVNHVILKFSSCVFFVLVSIAERWIFIFSKISHLNSFSKAHIHSLV